MRRFRAGAVWLAGLSLAILSVCPTIWAGEAKDVFTVTFISSELIYLNGGADEGLAVGDRGVITKKDSSVAEIEVAYVASHSSSGRVLPPGRDARVGDSVHITSRAPRVTAPLGPETSLANSGSAQTSDSQPPVRRVAPSQLASLSGSVYLFYNQWDDRDRANLGYRQANMSLSMQVRRIAGKDLTLSVRTNGRRDQRSLTFGQGGPKDEWSSHISALYLTYNAAGTGTTIQLGRMAAPRVGGIGFVDGLLIEQRASKHFAIGALGGAQPRWQYSENITSLERFGAYLSYAKGDYRTTQVELTLAGVGEYHDAVLSREVLYTQERLSAGDRFSILQNSEIDVNRGWRRERAGEAFTLTSFYISGRYRLSNWLTTGLTYDDRKNYWTYEIRTLADSLFDSHFRQGLHTQWDLTLPARVTAAASFGIQGLSEDSNRTYSYTASLRKGGLWNAGSTFDLQGAGFSGLHENGYDLSTRVGQYIHGRSYIGVGLGQYSYTGAGSGGAHRVNRWVEGSVRYDILLRLSASTEYRYSTGDDVNGQRIQASLSYML